MSAIEERAESMRAGDEARKAQEAPKAEVPKEEAPKNAPKEPAQGASKRLTSFNELQKSVKKPGNQDMSGKAHDQKAREAQAKQSSPQGPMRS